MNVARIHRSGLVLIGLLVISLLFARMAAASPSIPEAPPSLTEGLAPIADYVNEAIRQGKTPGAVVLIGHQGKIVYRQAFGDRALAPEPVPMTVDTIFDLASLTKPIATGVAVMQLVERGKIKLDTPVRAYWKGFGVKGKKEITVRQLLTHTSGLRADLDMRPVWQGYQAALGRIIAEKPAAPPGSRFIYSDINFEVLGELVRRVSGLPLDQYCQRHIFTPLGMRDTGFNPPPELNPRIAPTEYSGKTVRCGRPQDPACFSMGGVAGHAGLFSTVDDLALFAQTFLNQGELHGVRILQAATVAAMTTPQVTFGDKRRGLAWSIEPPFAANLGDLPPGGAYGHLGYTGTSLWIDPLTQTYVIVLTNRLHPNGRGNVKELRAQIRETVSLALGPLVPAGNSATLSARESKTSKDTPIRPAILTGIDVLAEENFAPLAGKRVGLITNQTGLAAGGRRTIDLLYHAPGVKLRAIFSPEHGLFGRVDCKVDSTCDPVTGLPVYSLYGKVRRPTKEMLAGLDALVFDIQDAGTRFYTYISTMGYAMEAAAEQGLEFYVLDRPNPLSGAVVQGPLLDADLRSFTGYFPLPLRHGMTIGELARMFNTEAGIQAHLRIVPMQGYRRGDWYDETGLPWVAPSPNLRSLIEATLYPGVALLEGANVSVGRGTDTPFELFGAPWIDARRLVDYLQDRQTAGVTFAPLDFTPVSGPFKGKVCHGVRLTLVDRQVLNVATLGLDLVEALHRLYPGVFQIERTKGLIGSREVLAAIKNGEGPETLPTHWQPALTQFLALRAKYLLY